MTVRERSPRVVAVLPDSPAERAGIQPGDEIVTLNGVVPRDIIEWRLLSDEPDVSVGIRRSGLEWDLDIVKPSGVPLGAEVSSAVFDRVRTCDNHCPFCFIYQLPPGMRSSLYLKDDDYRLSFLYGNFTTLTRFTESDLERVVSEALSPLHVSIHATDPDIRSGLLRNRRGGPSLRWLTLLLEQGIQVNGQIVVCPGLNDGPVLESTFLDVLDRFADLHHVAVVPLGISRFNKEPDMRLHTRAEAEQVVDLVETWQRIFLDNLGRRMVFAADEYYLMAGRAFPEADSYEGFAMHEDGVGMARTFQAEFDGDIGEPTRPQSGFFAWVDGAPAEGYRAVRNPAADTAMRSNMRSDRPFATVPVRLGARPSAPIGILTGAYGALVLRPLVASLGQSDVRVIPVENRFFGGNTAVTGLMVGEDLIRTLSNEPAGHRYLLPDVCLSEGRFLDGTTPSDLPRAVEVVPTDGISLRKALGGADR